MSETSSIRTKMGLAITKMPWSDQGARYRGVPASARQVDLANIQYWRMRLQHSTPPAVFLKHAYVNLSQGLERGSLNQRNVPCFGVNSLIYSYARDCTLSGAAHLRCMGWPKEYCSFSDGEHRNLAGESFSCPIAATIMTALWLQPYAEWWAESVSNVGQGGA